MLFYGPSSCLSRTILLNAFVFNLTTMKEGFPRLSYLLPMNVSSITNDLEFDIAYANYIMSNDNAFVEFFQLIYNLYIGKDIVILSDLDPNIEWSENLVESLLKFIQERYGYNSIKIESDEDYIYAKNNCSSDFNPEYGLYNLDMDKERFYSLVSRGVTGSFQIKLD